MKTAGMSEADCKRLGELVSECDRRDQSRWQERQRRRSALQYEEEEPTFTSRAKRWGVTPSMVTQVRQGTRSVSPILALRMLRDLKPNASEVAEFLEVTHLKELLAEMAETCRQAGYASALSEQTGLVYGNEFKTLASRRLAVELEAMPRAIKTFSKSAESRTELGNILDNWKKQISSEDLVTAYEEDEDFHKQILVAAYGQAGADERMEGLRLTRDAYDAAYGQGRAKWGGTYRLDEEWAIYRLHERISDALLQGRRHEAAALLTRHYEWLWEERLK